MLSPAPSSLSATSNIIALASCALSHYVQHLYNSLSCSISKFDANSRQLHSTSSNPICIPRVKTKAGTRAFSVATSTVWNSLPASGKSDGNIVLFRRRLRTYLCNASIDDSRIGILLRVCLIPWFCRRATELDLRGHWRKRSRYYYV